MILSGMNATWVMNENIEFIRNFTKISDREKELINEARIMLENYKYINCTGCDYCKGVCPQQIPISSYFKLYNECVSEKSVSDEHKNEYKQLSDIAKLTSCLDCERCEDVCPQHLEITFDLIKVYEFFVKTSYIFYLKYLIDKIRYIIK